MNQVGSCFRCRSLLYLMCIFFYRSPFMFLFLHPLNSKRDNKLHPYRLYNDYTIQYTYCIYTIAHIWKLVSKCFSHFKKQYGISIHFYCLGGRSISTEWLLITTRRIHIYRHKSSVCTRAVFYCSIWIVVSLVARLWI